MSIRRYRAASIQEAFRMAKAELGPDALVIEVRRVPLVEGEDGRRDEVEISAMADPGAAAGAMTPRRPPDEEPDIESLARRAQAAQAAQGLYQRHAPGGPLEPGAPGQLNQAGLLSALAQLGLAPPLINELAAACLRAPSAASRRGAVAHLLESGGVVAPERPAPPGRQVVALVGPSGVGKSTTIAKLAAVASQAQKKRVALITTDTYRVGAVAQLQSFAQILRVPIYTASTHDELITTLQEATAADAVFIDTPGSNPYNGDALRELRNLLGSRGTISSYLTLSMTSDFADLLQAGTRYALLSPSGLIVTKIDETTRAPMMVGLAQRFGLPLHYICTGPQVPEDISLATPDLLADLTLQALERMLARPGR